METEEGVSIGTQAVLGAFGELGDQKQTAVLSLCAKWCATCVKVLGPSSIRISCSSAGLSIAAVVLYVAWLVVRAVTAVSNRYCTMKHSAAACKQARAGVFTHYECAQLSDVVASAAHQSSCATCPRCGVLCVGFPFDDADCFAFLLHGPSATAPTGHLRQRHRRPPQPASQQHQHQRSRKNQAASNQT